MRGVRTEGPMAPEVPLDRQRPAEYVFDRQVTQFMADTHSDKSKVRASQRHSAA
jgi:hypothetical protein